MSPLDAAFLDLEDEEPQVSLAISSVAVLDGPAPSPDEFLCAIRARLPLVRRYRQKPRLLPFDLGSPVWVDDPDFDLSNHVRRTSLAGRADDTALYEQIGEIMSQRLVRDRPLWEYWVIDGLSGGRWAMVSKVHHCLVDGVSGTNLYHVIFDPSPGGREVPEDTWQPEPEPSTVSLAAMALRDLALAPVEQIRLAVGALRSPGGTARRIAETARGLAKLAGALWPASPTTLVGPIGHKRRYAAARAPLRDVIDVAHRAQVSLNDVVLAAITGAYRSLLRQRGEYPDAHAVRSLVPVSVRAPGEEGTCENRVSLMLAFLPVHIAGPVPRLKAVHAHMAELKASREAQAGEAMTTLARHEPFPPISWGVRLMARIPQRHIVTVTTNVPGPRQPLYLLGRRVREILPYVPIASRLRTGVSIFTYCDQVTFGVTGDYDNAPEVEQFARAVEDEMRALIHAYHPVPAPVPAARAKRPAAKPRKAAAASPPRGAPKTRSERSIPGAGRRRDV